MRALLIKDQVFEKGQTIEIEGNSFHHLKVARIRDGEELLLLNGNGVKAFAKIVSQSKKSAQVEIEKVELNQKLHNLKIFLAPPKKDACEEIIKNCIELGISELFQIKSQFSQFEIIDNERIQNIIESAMIQSNNPFGLKINPMQSFDNFIKNLNGTVACFSSIPQPTSKLKGMTLEGFLIGPEGGFSKEEEELLKSSKHIQMIHLSFPIMRSPTATTAAMGYLASLTQD